MALTSIFITAYETRARLVLETSERPSFNLECPDATKTKTKYTTNYASSGIVLCCVFIQQIVCL